MGIFSKVFGSGKKPYDLQGLVKDTCEALAEIRQSWFNLCVEAIQQELSVLKEVAIVNKHLDGDADNAIRAYQLFLVTDFLKNHNFMTAQETKHFSSLLVKHLCGTKSEKFKMYWNRYIESKETQQLFRFSSDVAKYITGLNEPLAESMFLSIRCFPTLLSITQMAVAHTFGDEKTVQKLENNFKKIAEKSASEWKDKLMFFMRDCYDDEITS